MAVQSEVTVTCGPAPRGSGHQPKSVPPFLCFWLVGFFCCCCFFFVFPYIYIFCCWTIFIFNSSRQVGTASLCKGLMVPSWGGGCHCRGSCERGCPV